MGNFRNDTAATPSFKKAAFSGSVCFVDDLSEPATRLAFPYFRNHLTILH